MSTIERTLITQDLQILRLKRRIERMKREAARQELALDVQGQALALIISLVYAWDGKEVHQKFLGPRVREYAHAGIAHDVRVLYPGHDEDVLDKWEKILKS